MDKTEFSITLAHPSQIPDLFNGPFLKGNRAPRIAVVGRSNVGKSSLINALLEIRSARTSQTPGKTRAIYFYLWKKIGKMIVDLPGYGYALASRGDREKWEELIEVYFNTDENLERVILLLDSRHGPTELDKKAIQFLSLRGIPVTFVFTKADTLKTQQQRAARQKEATQAIQDLGFKGYTLFWVSSRKQIGLKKLIENLGEE